MLANEGWLPSERIQINKHHGWRASKHSRMAGRISGSDSEMVLKAANRRFCAFFRHLRQITGVVTGRQSSGKRPTHGADLLTVYGSPPTPRLACLTPGTNRTTFDLGCPAGSQSQTGSHSLTRSGSEPEFRTSRICAQQRVYRSRTPGEAVAESST